MTTQARGYIILVILAGAALLVWQLPQLSGEHGWWLFVIGLLATFGQVLQAEGATVRSSYNAGLAAFGFTLLAFGLPAALSVMVAACLVDWAWHKYPWYIQTFNIALLGLSLGAAELAYQVVTQGLGTSQAIEVGAAAAASLVFLACNHLGVGGVIHLARHESLRESGVFDRLPMVVDGAVFSLGALTGALWSMSPLVLVIAIVPLYPIYLALRVPSLERQVTLDAKTNLLNATHFNMELEKELERSHRFDRPLTVVLGDLDLLRNINNTFGHLAGDVVLVSVAAILKKSVREYDLVARFGGEEFAILMPETTPEDAAMRMDDIRRHIAASGYEVSTSERPISATMSFGVAGRAHAEQTATQLMHQADLAVYRAKLEGRNKVRIAEHTDDTAALFHMAPPQAVDPANGDEGTTPAMTAPAPATQEVASERGGEATSKAPVDRGALEMPEDRSREPRRAPLSRRAVSARLAAVAAITLAGYGAAFLLLGGTGTTLSRPEFIQGLVVFAAMAVVAELLAIEIYARDTSVSTSAAVLMGGAVLFGPAGVLVLSLLASAAAMAKSHSPISRVLFNTCTHSLAGLGAVAITTAIAPSLTSYGHWAWAAACLGAAFTYYAFTTSSVAWAISWTEGESARRVWRERFQWLAPYYMGLGLAAYGLIFGYLVAGPMGVLVVVTPMLLLRLAHRQYLNRTTSTVRSLRESNERLTITTQQVSQLGEELLTVVASATDARDPYVVDHSKNVSRYATLIAQQMGISGDRLQLVRKAGLLHDIGKLGVPESILFKPARLTRPEYAIVQNHSRQGAEILVSSHSLADIAAIILHHHEHFDGRGYPDGLAEKDIPLEARIIALADAVEAMASDRPYRTCTSASAILEEIRTHAGTQFDPTAVAAFCTVVERQGFDLIVNGAVHGSQVAEVREPRSAPILSAVPAE